MSYAEQVLTDEFKAEMERTAKPYLVSFQAFDMGHEVGMGIEAANGFRRAIRTNNGQRVHNGRPSLTVVETHEAFRRGLGELLEFAAAGFAGESQLNS